MKSIFSFRRSSLSFFGLLLTGQNAQSRIVLVVWTGRHTRSSGRTQNKHPFPALAHPLRYNDLMLVLALDSSSTVGSLAALRDEQLVGVVSSESQETHSTR